VAVLALVVTMPLGVASAAGRPDIEGTAARPTIVLVHGAWADASGWAAVTERLQDQGYTVIALANPLRGVPSDAAYLTSVLATISGPIVLVGHSYGGAVITNAATGNPNVKALVFIAAFAPDAGETLAQILAMNPGSQAAPPNLTFRPYPGGLDTYIAPSAFHVVFCADGRVTAIYRDGGFRRCDQYQPITDSPCAPHFDPGAHVPLIVQPKSGSAPLRIGTKDARHSFFAGAVSRVRLWNRALTADEVTRLFTADKFSHEGMVAEYLLNEGKGLVAGDSASTHPGEIHGANWSTA